MIVKVENFDDFRQEVEACSGRILIKFEADWCMPCRAAAPIVEEFARQNPDVKVVVVDIEGDGLEPVLKKYNVRAVPTFVQMNEGLSVRAWSGLVNRTELLALLGD